MAIPATTAGIGAITTVTTTRARVLVVDDDTNILTMFDKALSKLHDVTCMSDGLKARDLLEERDFSCVIADQLMPTLSGTEVLIGALRMRPHAARILVTASDRLFDVQDAVNLARVHRFLVKPVRLADLAGVVDDAVKVARLEAENARLIAELKEKNLLLQRALAAVQESERKLEREVEVRTEQLVKANANLEEIALRDGMTGLYNHRFFQEALVQELARARRYQQPVSLLFVDVDHFKHYNDRNGHPEGDELLRQLARIMVASDDADFVYRGRTSDIVARYGGEEFCILLPATDEAGARVRAERVRSMVADYAFAHREHQPLGTVSVSIGVATFPDHAADGVGLVRAADDALLEAKRAGRNRVVVTEARASSAA